MALSDIEIGFIKAMLLRRMANKDIQFYFNTPQAPVNNGRISEIKSGARGPDVAAASQFELDDFLENHPLTKALRSEEEPVLPEQIPAASIFTILDTQKVDVVPDPPTAPDHDQAELYGELIHKTELLLELGSNALGEADNQVRRFKEALPEGITNASIVRIWARGNSLRATLRAHDENNWSEDFPLGRLEALCAERLRDLIDILNVFIAHDPKGNSLDQAKLGPDQADQLASALEAIRVVIADAKSITTDRAYDQLNSQLEGVERNPRSPQSGQAVAVAANSASNFFVALIKNSFWFLKKQVVGDLGDFFKTVRVAGYTYVGATITANIPPAMIFLAEHAPVVHDFLLKVTVNESLMQVLKFVTTAIIG